MPRARSMDLKPVCMAMIEVAMPKAMTKEDMATSRMVNPAFRGRRRERPDGAGDAICMPSLYHNTIAGVTGVRPVFSLPRSRAESHLTAQGERQAGARGGIQLTRWVDEAAVRAENSGAVCAKVGRAGVEVDLRPGAVPALDKSHYAIPLRIVMSKAAQRRSGKSEQMVEKTIEVYRNLSADRRNLPARA